MNSTSARRELRQAPSLRESSPRTLMRPFSPWEICDINRSTCLPYNPLALGIKKDIVRMTNEEFYVIGAWWKDLFFFCGALTVSQHLHTRFKRRTPAFSLSPAPKSHRNQARPRGVRKRNRRDRHHLWLTPLFHRDQHRPCSSPKLKLFDARPLSRQLQVFSLVTCAVVGNVLS